MMPTILATRKQIDTESRLPPALVGRMHEASLFTPWLPRAFGGHELHPAAFFELIETLSSADGSVGWCTAVAGVFTLLASRLPEPVARQIFREGTLVAGAIAPAGTAVEVAGGYRVTGLWKCASGIDHASWIVGNCMTSNDRGRQGDQASARFMFLPKEQVEVLDTWHVGGLRGTGSHNFRVEDVFVPRQWSISAVDPIAVQDAPLYRVPLISLFVLAIAAVPMGIARAALDAFARLGGDPVRESRLQDKPAIQASVARAEGLVRAARAYVFAAIAGQWGEVAADQSPSVCRRTDIRLACTFASEASETAVDLICKATGSHALYESGPLERCFRDVHAATRHVGLSAENYEIIGRALGGEPNRGF